MLTIFLHNIAFLVTCAFVAAVVQTVRWLVRVYDSFWMSRYIRADISRVTGIDASRIVVWCLPEWLHPGRQTFRVTVDGQPHEQANDAMCSFMSLVARATGASVTDRRKKA